MPYCWKCAEELKITGKPERKEVCSRCNAYLRCCYNCQFYDPSASQQCREPQVDLVKDKERANFCEYFVFVTYKRTRKEKNPSKNDIKKKLNSLFKDEEE
jgi:hypothetical protein